MGVEKNGEVMILSKNPEHFQVVHGLCGMEGSISFKSIEQTFRFLRLKDNGRIYLDFIDPNDSSDLDKRDSCFYPRANKYFDVRLLLTILHL